MAKKEKSKNQVPEKKQSVNKTTVLNSKTPKNFTPSKFELFINKYSFVSLIGLILLAGLFAFRDFLFFKYVYIFKDIGSDTLNTFFPQAYLTEELTKNGAPSTWSFQVGMGQTFFSGVPVFANPFYYLRLLVVWVQELLWHENHFIYGKFIRIFLKYFMVIGLLFYIYLRSLSIDKYTSLLGGFLAAFIGHSVLGSSWEQAPVVLSTIFVLFATEQLFSKKRWYFFPIGVILISANPFSLYINALFVVIYLVFRFFYFEDSKVKEYLLTTAKMILLGIVGLVMNLTNIVISYLDIFDSPRVGGTVGFYSKLSDKSIFSTQGETYGEQVGHHLTAMYRFFSNDILGTGTDFKGWYNYLEAPIFYAGLITLLLVPQLFQFINKRQKLTVALYLSFWTILIIFPFFRYAFNAFAGDYYRVGLDTFVPVSLLLLAIFAFNFIYKQIKLNIPVLFATLGVLLLALYFPYFGSKNLPVVESLRNLIALFLILYSFVFVGLKYKEYRSFSLIAILVLVFVEITVFSYYTVNKRDAYLAEDFTKNGGGYYDNTVDAVKFIKKTDKSFFRLEKDYSSGTAMHGSLNDAMVQGYYGTTSYSSFNQGRYIHFLQRADVISDTSETQTRWSPGLRGQPLLSTWGNVKYYLSKNDNSPFLQLGYKVIQKVGSVNVLKNSYYLPMGYTYTHYMPADDFDKLSRFQKDMALLNYAIIENTTDIDNFIPQYAASDSISSITENKFGMSFFNFSKNDFDTTKTNLEKTIYAQYRNNLIADTLAITSHGDDFINGTISLKQAKVLFLTIPYSKGWHATINGKEHQIIDCNMGFSGLKLEPGNYTIELKFTPLYLDQTLWITYTSNVLYILVVLFVLFRNRQKNKV